MKAQKKKKLLFLVSEDWYFCSHRLGLAKTALDAGFDVSVATRVNRHGALIEASGLKLLPLSSFDRSSIGPAKGLSILWELFLLYRRERPDIVHQVGLKPVLYGTLAARCARISGVVNAIAGFGYVFSSNKWGYKILRVLFLLLLRTTMVSSNSRLIVQNRTDYDYSIKNRLIGPENLKLVRSSGIDPGEFPYSEPAESENPVVMLASRMIRDKGIEDFVRAARILADKGVEARFVLAGGVVDRQRTSISLETLEAWNEEGVIEWLGHRDDMPRLLAGADIVCLPSFYGEGIPKILIEAMACGRPIVTTDTPGCRELVDRNNTGYLVPAHSAIALARALEQLIADRAACAKMGLAGYEMVHKEFLASIINSQILEIYADLET